MAKVIIELENEEISNILIALGKFPYEQVSPLVSNIHNQVQKQVLK